MKGEESVRLPLRKNSSGTPEDKKLARLYEMNRGLVYRAAEKFRASGYDFEELFQAGSIGLLQAIRRYDCRFQVQFSTYAVPLIFGEIRRFLRESNPLKVQRSVTAQYRRLRRTEETLQKRLGRAPSVGELAEESGIPREEIGFILQAWERPRSLEEPVAEGESLLDRLTEGGAGERVMEYFSLREAIGRLPEREQFVLGRRYFREETQQTIAKRLGLSQVQVSRIERTALRRLRAFLEER